MLGAEVPDGPDRITRNIYDAAGQLLQVREGVGTAVEAAEATYAYTPNGKKALVIDANGNKAELRYDGHDQQVRWVFPRSAVLPPGIRTRTPLWPAPVRSTSRTTRSTATTPTATAPRCASATARCSLSQYDALNRMTLKEPTSAPGSPPPTPATFTSLMTCAD